MARPYKPHGIKGTKVCNRCKVEKQAAEFLVNSCTRDGLHSTCRDCQSAALRKRYQENKEHVGFENWKHSLRRNFGLTYEDYLALLEGQEGKCAGCGARAAHSKARNLCVDHDHKTGRVRGLLCTNCNRAVGHMQNDPEIARKLAHYLSI